MTFVAPGTRFPLRPLTGVLVALLFALGLPAAAAPLARDLGDGLRYFRAKSLPDDLPAADVAAGPLVLDLRYAKAESAAGVALEAWIRFRAAPRRPVIVLVNAASAPAIRAVLAHLKTQAGVITIGTAAGGFVPDLAVNTTEAAEHRAYDALESGTPVRSLTVEDPPKERIDEASLMRERAGEVPTSQDLAPGDEATAAPPPLIDAALQRAVQLHRALRALKRV